MSELNSLKRKFRQCSRNGFWLDRNTFLKSDDVDVTPAKFKDDYGKTVERPMIIFKNVAIMVVNQKGNIISIDKKPSFGVWARVAENALEQIEYNSQP
jgi:hypothetical protein